VHGFHLRRIEVDHVERGGRFEAFVFEAVRLLHRGRDDGFGHLRGIVLVGGDVVRHCRRHAGCEHRFGRCR
jgi:hypothetical protein